MPDQTIPAPTADEKTALIRSTATGEVTTVLPEYGGANANITAEFWAAGSKARAHAWTNHNGDLVLSLSIGTFTLSVSPEQWSAIKQLVDSVVPEQVSA